MPTIITTQAQEQSFMVFTVAFTDELDAATVPSAITWTLTDSSGTVVNSREDVAVGTPAASVDIVLSGDDLSILSGETASIVSRRLTVKAVVDTDAGSNLPVKAEAVFPLENLLNVS